MKHIQKGASFFAGFLISAIIFSMGSPALAALYSNWIEVYTGVNIYVDDQLLHPVDANGNPVEAFVYNGTTYLPVRAVGEAVGKTVQWEAKTSSVYLGTHISDKPVVWLKDLDYFTGSSSIATKESEKDNTGAVHNHCITESFSRTYILNGQYSKLTGALYQTYDQRSGWLFQENGLEIYGDGELLYSHSFTEYVTSGMAPIAFEVDLTGVLKLEIHFETDRYHGSPLSIGECGLWT